MSVTMHMCYCDSYYAHVLLCPLLCTRIIMSITMHMYLVTLLLCTCIIVSFTMHMCYCVIMSVTMHMYYDDRNYAHVLL